MDTSLILIQVMCWENRGHAGGLVPAVWCGRVSALRVDTELSFLKQIMACPWSKGSISRDATVLPPPAPLQRRVSVHPHHPSANISLHLLPSRVPVHAKYAAETHGVFQPSLIPKPFAKKELVKSCFSQKDEMLSCLPLQDDSSRERFALLKRRHSPSE